MTGLEPATPLSHSQVLYPELRRRLAGTNKCRNRRVRGYGLPPKQPIEIPCRDGVDIGFRQIERLSAGTGRPHRRVPAAREERRVRSEEEARGPATSKACRNTSVSVSPGDSRSVFELDGRGRHWAEVRHHQRFAEHAGAEVRDDDRQTRMGRAIACRSRGC